MSTQKALEATLRANISKKKRIERLEQDLADARAEADRLGDELAEAEAVIVELRHQRDVLAVGDIAEVEAPCCQPLGWDGRTIHETTCPTRDHKETS